MTIVAAQKILDAVKQKQTVEPTKPKLEKKLKHL